MPKQTALDTINRLIAEENSSGATRQRTGDAVRTIDQLLAEEEEREQQRRQQTAYQKALNDYTSFAPMDIAKASQEALDSAKSRDNDWWQARRNEASADATKQIAKTSQEILNEKKEPEPVNLTLPAPSVNRALNPALEAEYQRHANAQGTNVAPGAWAQNQMKQANDRQAQAQRNISRAPSGWKDVGLTIGGTAANFLSGSGSLVADIARLMEIPDDILYSITKNERFNLDRAPGLRDSEALRASDQFAEAAQNASDQVGKFGQQLISTGRAAGNMMAYSALLGNAFGQVANPGRMASLSNAASDGIAQIASKSSLITSAAGRAGAKIALDVLTNPGNVGISLGSAINSYSDAYANGATIGQALANGVGKGLAEYFSNKMFSGTPFEDAKDAQGYVSRLVEHIAKDTKWEELLKAFNSSTGGKAANWFIDKIGEGLEEVITGLADPVVDKLTYKWDTDMATFDELTDEFFGGVLLSLLMSGGEALMNQVVTGGKADERRIADAFVSMGVKRNVANKFAKKVAEATTAVTETEGWLNGSYNGKAAELMRNQDYAEKSAGKAEVAAQAQDSDSESLQRYAGIFNRIDEASKVLSGTSPSEVSETAWVNEQEARNYFYIWETQGAKAADAYYEQTVLPGVLNKKARAQEQFDQIQRQEAEKAAQQEAARTALQDIATAEETQPARDRRSELEAQIESVGQQAANIYEENGRYFDRNTGEEMAQDTLRDLSNQYRQLRQEYDNLEEVNNGQVEQQRTEAPVRAAESGTPLPSGGQGRVALRSLGESAQKQAGQGGFVRQGQRAYDRRNRKGSARKVKASELGLTGAKEGAETLVFDRDQWDDDMRETADLVKRATGLDAVFVLGNIDLDDGGSIRGAFTGNSVIVQCDHPEYTVAQLAAHESYHALAASNPGLDEQVKAYIRSVAGGEAKLREITGRYIEKLGDVFGLSDDMTEAEYQAAKAAIEQEVLADAFAGMNVWGAGATQISSEVRGAVNANRQNVAATERTTGPPVPGRLTLPTNPNTSSQAAPATSDDLADALANGDIEQATQYSYEAIARAGGFKAVEIDGERYFVDDTGTRVKEVTAEQIMNSPIGTLINFAAEEGYLGGNAEENRKAALGQAQFFADIMSLAATNHDFAMSMNLAGAVAFTAIKANSDTQYKTTYDFKSICIKTQAIINNMSAAMVAKKGALTQDEILELYRATAASGQPVSCPECYVFSRWVGIGGLLDNIWKYQQRFSKMTPQQVVENYNRVSAEVERAAEASGLSFGKAKSSIGTKVTKKYNELREKIEKADNVGEYVKPADRKALAELEKLMVDVKSLTWVKDVYFGGKTVSVNNKQDDKNIYVPADILFDLNKGGEFATNYKNAWAFRTTQGAGYGKAITPYAAAELGEGILGVSNLTKTVKAKAAQNLNNPYLNSRGKIDNDLRKKLRAAVAKEKTQLFRGGQRFSSTSDMSNDVASDLLISMLEMQTMNAGVQMYTKVDGAVGTLSRMGAFVNQSLMPMGGGLVDGKVQDTSVGGMKPSVAFKNREDYESAGTITIGVNDNHIRALVRLVERDFVIPYHASGGNADLIAEMRVAQDPSKASSARVRSTDYTRTQGEKVLTDLLLQSQGKTPAEIDKIHKTREARIAILTQGKPNMDIVRGNPILSKLYDEFHGGKWDGVKLTKDEIKHFIYPNEFWDTTVDYEHSGVNTQLYLDYCEALGFLHKFSGMVQQSITDKDNNTKTVLKGINGYDENGNKVPLTDLAYVYDSNGNRTDEIEPYFWKLLVDRRMYGNDGRYLEQGAINLSGIGMKDVVDFAKVNAGRQYDDEKSREMMGKVTDIFSRNKETPQKILGEVQALFGTLDSKEKAQVQKAKKAGASGKQVKNNVKYSREINALTYFSGGGLVDYAMRDVIGSGMAVEFDKGAAAVYALNNGKVYVGDVRNFSKTELAKMDGVEYFHASPVCKNYSRMNIRRSQLSDGNTDITTAQATADAIRGLDSLKVFTLEQVPEYDGSDALKIITDALDEMGFVWDKTVANAHDYGGATSRERLMLRAVKDGKLPPLPAKVKGYSWFEATADLITGLEAKDRLSPFMQERIDRTPELVAALKNQTEPILLLGGTPGGKAWWSSASDPCPSITTDMQDARILMPDGTIRKPNPRFFARIMGLPDSYKFSQWRNRDNATQGYKVIGNGVPVQLTQKFFGNLLDDALNTGVKYSREEDMNNELEDKLSQFAKAVDAPQGFSTPDMMSSLYHAYRNWLDDERLLGPNADVNKAKALAREIDELVRKISEQRESIRNESVGDWAIRMFEEQYANPGENLLEGIHDWAKYELDRQNVWKGEWEPSALQHYNEAYERTDFSDINSVKKFFEDAEAAFKENGERGIPVYGFYDEEHGNSVRFSREERPEVVERLDQQMKDGNYVIVYHSMYQDKNGKLYSPMAGKKKVGNEWVMTDPYALNTWYKSDVPENIADLIENGTVKLKDSGGWSFLLKKPETGGTDVPAALNPWNHASTDALNDQFNAAFARETDEGELVTVECVIPLSEVDPSVAVDPETGKVETKPYEELGMVTDRDVVAKPDSQNKKLKVPTNIPAGTTIKPKDSVGLKMWKAGPVHGQISGKRPVYLSRWIRNTRVLSTEETAKMIAKTLKDENFSGTIPGNVVGLKLRKALENEGVKFGSPTNKGYYAYMSERGYTKQQAEGEKLPTQQKYSREEDEAYPRYSTEEEEYAPQSAAEYDQLKKAGKIKAEKEKVKKPVAKSKATIAKKDLRNTLITSFSIPDGFKADIGKMIDGIADRIIRDGRVSYQDQEELFDKLYSTGEMTVPADDTFAAVRNELVGSKIYVPEAVKHEFGEDWADIRKEAFGHGIYFTNNPDDMAVDVWNSDVLAFTFPGVFNENAHPHEVIERLLSVARAGKAEKMSLPEYAAKMVGAEFATEDDMMTNLERQLDWALRTFADKAGLEIYLKDRTGVKLAEEREKFGRELDRRTAAEIARRAKERDKLKEAAQKAREQKAMRELQQKTLKQLQWLNKNRFKFSGDMKAEVDKLLEDIDTYAISAANELHLDKKRNMTWRDIRDLYLEAKESDPNFLPSKELERIVARLDYKKIGDLDVGALTDLYKAAVGLRTELYNRNNLIADELHQTFQEVYDAAKDEINEAPGSYNTGGKGFWNKYWNDAQLTPMNRLQRMAGWNPDSRWYGMAKMLEHGERAQRRFKTESARQLAPVLEQYKDWIKTADGQGKNAVWYKYEVPESWEYRMGDKPVFSDKTVTVWMTPAQKVHMYLESKNYDNLRHMEGGRTFANKELYSKGERTEAFAQGTTVRLLPETVKAMVSDLTPEEQALADALEKYYNGFSKDEINRVSNLLYGYDKAMEASYAPIYTNNNYTKSEPGNFDVTAEGVGNLKSRVVSSNPSLNIGAFDAFEKSVDKTSKFVGLAIPVQNMNTLMNWREKGNSMKDIIDHKWGEKETKWIEDLLTELQSGNDYKRGSVEKLTNAVLSKYISAVFGANPSIVAKQFASYPLAATYLGWENMPKFVPTAAQVDTDLMAKYTGELDYRLLGYATPETATLKDNPSKLQQKGPLNFLLGGGAITWMDGFTVRTLWTWAENKVKREQPDLERGTQGQIDAGESEYYKAVAKEFEEAVSRSQPMYDVMHRSNIMRESNPVTRALTLFKTVPQQELNMLRQAIGEAEYYKRTKADADTLSESRTKVGRAALGVITGNLMIGLITFLNALWKNRAKRYRDEDGELNAESVIGAALKQYVKDSAGLVVGGGEAADLLSAILLGDKWYGLEMPGIEQIGSILEQTVDAGTMVKDIVQGSIDVLSNGGDWGQYMADNSEKYLAAVDKAVSSIGTYATGLPMDNLKAYLLGTVTSIFPQIQTAYEDATKQAVKGGLKGLTGASLEVRAKHILQDRAGKVERETIEALTALYEAGYDKVIPSAQQKSLTVKGEERELNVAQQQIYKNIWKETVGGALDELVNSKTFLDADDKTQAKMIEKLYDVAAEKAKGVLFDDYESTTENKLDAMQSAGASVADYAATTGATADAKRADSYETILASDMSDEAKLAAIGNIIGTDMTTDSGNPTQWARLNTAVKDGMSVDDAMDLMQNELLDDYDRWRSSDAKKAGIGWNIYKSYKTDTGAMKADKDANGKSISGTKKTKVLDYINRMNITKSQKDTLYYDAGYTENGLKDAPWHQSGGGNGSGNYARLTLPTAKKPWEVADDMELRSMNDYGGNVDLTNRKSIPITQANIGTVRGWNNMDDAQIGDRMTVASQTYNDGDTAIVVTPILPDGTLMTQRELDRYMDSIIRSGDYANADKRGIILGVFDDGDWNENLAASDEFANRLHELHERKTERRSGLRLPEAPKVTKSSSGLRLPATNAAPRQSSGLRLK